MNRVSAGLLSLRNALDFPLRRLFRWHRPGYRLPGRSSDDLYADLPAGERQAAETLAGRLRRQYQLDPALQDSSAHNFRENLFYLHLLEQALERSGAALPAEIQAADIGPSHWFYVQALYRALQWFGGREAARQVTVRGFETDPYRVYADLYARRDHALAHMRANPDLQYIPTGFTRQPGRFDCVTLFFPFVFLPDHLRWGLPPAVFQPAALLRDAWESLRPGGILLIANQGEAEHRAHAQALRDLGIPTRAGFLMQSPLFHYDLERYILVAYHEP